MAEQLRMPRVSKTMTEGRVVEWLKREGERVKAGEPLVTVESDKASLDLTAPTSGILRRVLVNSGEEVKVDTPLAILGAEDEDISSLLVPISPTEAPARSVPGVSRTERPAALGVKRTPISPAARRLAKELGVDVSELKGTGLGGLVTEKDVRAFVSSSAPLPAVEEAEIAEEIPFTGLRLRIAERLSLSRRTAADVTTVVDVDMSEIESLRTISQFSYTAYVSYALSRALQEFPILNASLAQDRILIHKNIHLGIAVALPDGLVVPVLRYAGQKNLEQIAREIDQLAARARERQLTGDELTGSTFTITNSGGFGSLLFTPIINQPEVAILGMGKVADTPVVRNGQVVARKIMYLCLSYDHRVVDGRPAVMFLQLVKRLLEHPEDWA